MDIPLKTSSEEVTRLDRIGAHSHIKGLGLTTANEPKNSSQGMVGQTKARRAMGIIRAIVEQRRISGKGVLLSGPPGTGKTALAIALSQSLSKDSPFTSISSSEVFSLEIGKTEALTQAFRKSIGVKISEETDIIEGEVVEIIIDKASEASNGLKLGKMTLKTTDMESIYDLGQKMVEALIKQKVESGDVIRINKTTGKVRRLGRSYSKSQDFDAMGANARFVSCPSGDLQKRETISHSVSLHEIDVINSRPQGFIALFSGETGEIDSEIRSQIDSKISSWTEEGKAQVIPGVLFIDEAHALDLECFSFINRALEDEFAPVLVLATNRGVVPIRGANTFKSAHGIPPDVLERFLIVPTFPYSEEELYEIIKIRCDEEEVKANEEAVRLLVKIGLQSSLRYALHLIISAKLLSDKRRANEVEISDVSRAYKMFMDTSRSLKCLEEEGEKFVNMEICG